MSSSHSNNKIKLQAILDHVKSAVNIKAAIKAINAKLPNLKIKGTLDNAKTKRELNQHLKTASPKIKVDADTSKAAQKIKKLENQKTSAPIQPTVDNSQIVSGLKETQQETQSFFNKFEKSAAGSSLIRMGVQKVTEAVAQAISDIKELNGVLLDAIFDDDLEDALGSSKPITTHIVSDDCHKIELFYKTGTIRNA